MTTLQPRSRIESVDILRGIVMVIMALDHVREFWGVAPFRPEDLTQTSTSIFFTRWITHFCAPTFIFLSGISIYFTGKRMDSKKALSVFLVKRGLWLVVLQVVLLSFLLQFSYNMIILEVIWVIGWSMIFMAALIWIPRKVFIAIAIILIGAHNLLPNITDVNGATVIPAMLHNSPAVIVVPGFPVVLIAYTIVPWVAVMAAGYLMASLFERSEREQVTAWRKAGLILLGLFVIIRAVNIYGDPAPWSVQERGWWFTFLSFINVTKYPPSLQFLTLTLGVACLGLSSLNNVAGKFVGVLKTFGQVPFFYYVIHVPLIVSGAYVWVYLRFGVLVSLAFQPDQRPADYSPSMLRTWIVWLAYLVILYFPCRWYADYKNNNRKWWLSYL